MDGAALDADGFVLQPAGPVGVGGQRFGLGLGQHEAARVGVVLVGKGHLLLPLRRGAHGGHQQVQLFAVQRGNHGVPFGLHQFAAGLDFGAEGLGHIHIEALQFPLAVHGGKGRVGALDADFQRRLVGVQGQAEGEEKKEFFHGFSWGRKRFRGSASD